MSSLKNKNKNLISIEEFIARAKRFEVDFGNGDPKNRLRYYVKMGLLPHAERKSFNGSPPNGAYPEEELETLFEIDKKIKQGKTVQEIKREVKEKTLEDEKLKNNSSYYSGKTDFFYFQNQPWQIEAETKPESEQDKIFRKNKTKKEEQEAERIFEIEEKIKFDQQKNSFKTTAFKVPVGLKILFLILILFSTVFLGASKISFTDSIFSFLATINQLGGEPGSLIRILPDTSLQEESLSLPIIDPYLTINAETAINASLAVKDKVFSPSFALTNNQFQGIITVDELTAEREYIFPDLSGTVCLTTGNCMGLTEGVITSDGTVNRLAKFTSAQEIADSSISDFYLEGVAINIDSIGNIGIGTLAPRAKLEVAGNLIATGRTGIGGIENPLHSLHVSGRIQATGDICTDLVGGRCLSTLPLGGGGGGGTTIIQGSDIDGSGSTGYFSLWSDTTTLTDSILYQSNGNIGVSTTTPQYTLSIDGTFQTTGTSTFFGNVGINTITPQYALDVGGIVRMTGFNMPTGVSEGYILTADSFGFGAWQPPAIGTVPDGTTPGQTLRYGVGNWVIDSFLYNTGSKIGIGTTSVGSAAFTVSGNSLFHGPLTIQDSSLVNQLVLKHNDDNLLSFLVNGERAEISSSKTMFINSLTGQVVLGSDVNLFNAYNATVAGATFISTTTDSTVRKSGEMVFRGSIPVFRFPFPSQTNSTIPVEITREISPLELTASLPEALPGATRKFAFLINFTDDILVTASSTWLIDVTAGIDIEFYFAGQENSGQLDQGTPNLSSFFNPPANNWQLKVNVPLLGNNIRIFNVLLLVYDEIN